MPTDGKCRRKRMDLEDLGTGRGRGGAGDEQGSDKLN